MTEEQYKENIIFIVKDAKTIVIHKNSKYIK